MPRIVYIAWKGNNYFRGMENLSPTEQLDEVLRLMRDFPGKRAQVFHVADAKRIRNPLARMILRQLHTDGYLHQELLQGKEKDVFNGGVSVPTEIYYISFNGKMFIEKGGYKIDERKKIFRLFLTIVQAVALVTGTLLAGVYAYFSYSDNQKNQRHQEVTKSLQAKIEQQEQLIDLYLSKTRQSYQIENRLNEIKDSIRNHK